jgi:serine/threonine-protein kinase
MGAHDLAAGDVVGAYRLLEPIAEGGMAEVWRAEQRVLGRPAALKIVRAELAQDAEFRRRFAAEGRAAASIDAPNVVTVFDAGEVDGRPFLAMALIPGGTLRELLDRTGRLESARAVELVGQVAAGLDATHAAGLVHRDVKPANVLVDARDGRALITDFGVVKNLEASGVTRTGSMVGTLDYLAPEQVQGREVQPRTDVYALGCLLYELLAGSVPFPRASAPARLRAHLHDPPPQPSDVDGVPAAFDAVIATALAKVPEQRFDSAGDLARAASAALAGDRPEPDVVLRRGGA